MGVTLTGFSNLEAIGLHTEGICGDEEHICAFAYSSFPHSLRGLPILGRYRDGDDFLMCGCFSQTAATRKHRFDATYIGYGEWRDDLRRQFNCYTARRKPFYELIRFADNEGALGPDAASDLLADFLAHAARYEPRGKAAGFYRQFYADWITACELAAAAGLIQLH